MELAVWGGVKGTDPTLFVEDASACIHPGLNHIYMHTFNTYIFRTSAPLSMIAGSAVRAASLA